MTRRHPYDGVVGRLQNPGFPTDPATLATGLRLLPRWDYLPLNAPAFAGRTMSAFSVQKQFLSAIDVQKTRRALTRTKQPHFGASHEFSALRSGPLAIKMHPDVTGYKTRFAHSVSCFAKLCEARVAELPARQYQPSVESSHHDERVHKIDTAERSETRNVRSHHSSDTMSRNGTTTWPCRFPVTGAWSIIAQRAFHCSPEASQLDTQRERLIDAATAPHHRIPSPMQQKTRVSPLVPRRGAM